MMKGLLAGLGLVATAAGVPAAPVVPVVSAQGGARDSVRDFDFNIGRWRTDLKRLVRPLSGSREWVSYTGTSVVTRALGGRANLVELSVRGPAGTIEGVSLRLHDPQTGRWSLNFASARDGTMTPPVVGGFQGGRGEFLGDDTLGDRPIKVRFVIHTITPRSVDFEQAFSADGGRTWEVNWIARDTLIGR